MDKQIDKYPYKKVLYMQWYEAAIANLILFKCSHSNNHRFEGEIYGPHLFSYI